MIEDSIEYYEELTELEDEITEDAPAPIVCKSCGGGKWRSGRKDEASEYLGVSINTLKTLANMGIPRHRRQQVRRRPTQQYHHGGAIMRSERHAI